MNNLKRESAIFAAGAGLMPSQSNLDRQYKVTIIAIKTLGFTEEEAVDIVQEAMRVNAGIMKDKEVRLSEKSKEYLELLEFLGKLD